MTKEFLLCYGELIQAAQLQGVTTYQALAQLMGIPVSGNLMGKKVGEMLEEISKAELEAGRPLLSALCVNTAGRPSGGFYGLGQRAGRVRPGESEEAFWEREKKQVYKAWMRTYAMNSDGSPL